jgi:pimeloyl-ACP methyl ester carboxylesterase
MRETDVTLPDGGTLHAYDTGAVGGTECAVMWHHGTPNIGTPPAPLLAPGEQLGIRWVAYDRPGYGGSSAAPGRDVASAATYAAAVADALGIERFAAMGHSGGGPHALACAALLPERVFAVVAAAALAPSDADGLDYYAGMAASGVATLRAAAAGREARERHEREHGDDYDPEFTPADLAALAGPWGWFGTVVGPGLANGPGPQIDDDLAYAGPWGFDVAQVRAPVLLLHGGLDRIAPGSHAHWLAGRLPSAHLRMGPDDGHISVLTGAESALAWLVVQVR